MGGGGGDGNDLVQTEITFPKDSYKLLLGAQ